MDLEAEDAVAQRSDGGPHPPQVNDFERGEARDLLEQEGTQGGGERQIVLLALAEAGEHVAQDVSDLARCQLERWAGRTKRRPHDTLHRAWPWTATGAERAVPGEAVGRVVDIAVEAPKPLLREQRLGKDVGLLMGAGVNRLDAVTERLEFAAQGLGRSRLFRAQDGKPDRLERVRCLRNEHTRVQHRAHAGVIWLPIDLDIGICDHTT
ncbi:hypothetical protein FXB41_27970 [Bradyrhizobium canariense]|uniref:hypothetical protein n=1 Tax=Bradyrhizobium canariense TaxID=255045 RepID=UPI001CA4F811|nr:hypothetical protein [Bradyrhizobium canariense]MBW5438460.1 hypothetical protein [Bradyrhizobium canariense]